MNFLNCTNGTIQNNRINSSFNNIYSYFSIIVCDKIIFQNNHIKSLPYGLYLGFSQHSIIRNNTIQDCNSGIEIGGEFQTLCMITYSKNVKKG
jgi:nitrous oxidase accessory protein NosD